MTMRKAAWSVQQDLGYIVRAEMHEREGHILESEKLYEEGKRKLRQALKDCTNTANQKFYRKKLKQFEEKTELFHKLIEEYIANSHLMEEILIPEDKRGHSYAKLFKKYFSDQMVEVHIYEPIIEKEFHFKNLISFIELLVKSCRHLEIVRVITKRDPRLTSLQIKVFQNIKSDLNAGNINFNYQFDNDLLESRIIFNNGLIIKSNRGLHIYQPSASTYHLGTCDLDFCHCLKSEIKIYLALPFSKIIDTEDSEGYEFSDYDDEKPLREWRIK